MRKKATIAEIASRAGVSPASVSRVLTHKNIVKGDTYQKIVAVLRELNYPFEEEPAERLHEGKVLLLSISSLDNTFYNDIIKGIQASAHSHNFRVLVYPLPINEETINSVLATIRTIRPVGMISISHAKGQLLRQINKLTTVVQCCEYSEDSGLSYVSVDDYAAAQVAVQHILTTGHRNIAFINGPPENKYAQHRLRGFIDTLRANDIPVVNEWIVQSTEISFETAFASSFQLLNSMRRPNAFFAASDIYGAAIIKATQAVGLKVPNDVVVVSFDNLEVTQMTSPTLTSINQPKFQQGFAAAEVLFEIVQTGNTEQRKIMLGTELVVRQSSATH